MFLGYLSVFFSPAKIYKLSLKHTNFAILPSIKEKNGSHFIQHGNQQEK